MRRSVLVAGIVLLGALGAAVAGVAVVEVTANETGDDGDVENESAEPFGASVSAFMQSNAAAAEGEVDDGMFEARLNRTDAPAEREALFEQRQERLEERLERIENARAAVGAVERENASVAEIATAAHVRAGATGLERSLNATDRAAQRTSVEVERIDELRRNASELRGSAVAQLARGVAGVPEPGPPDHAGPSGDHPRNETGPPGDDDHQSGPPDDDDHQSGPPENEARDVPEDEDDAPEE